MYVGNKYWNAKGVQETKNVKIVSHTMDAKLPPKQNMLSQHSKHASNIPLHCIPTHCHHSPPSSIIREKTQPLQVFYVVGSRPPTVIVLPQRVNYPQHKALLTTSLSVCLCLDPSLHRHSSINQPSPLLYWCILCYQATVKSRPLKVWFLVW